MKVKNQKVIRHLSFRTMLASKKRNKIAIVAIALTTVLFTTLFTVLCSINDSYQTYQFKQCGGYCHGTFKDVTAEQIQQISQHKKVKETGERVVVGYITQVPFAKETAEISYMDENCTKWSYAEPTVGHEPQKDNEITMDIRALELLGVEPELGAQIKLTYSMADQNESDVLIEDTFTLSGYYPYDVLMPVHYINISRDYQEQMVQKAEEIFGQDIFRTDLNVMMQSGMNIEAQMKQVDQDLGYDWNTRDEANSVRIGVNWGYTSAQFFNDMNFSMIMTVIAFLVLIIMTGYLIIYNIFQISVASDIRFYGLLKAIGVTPKQLKRIIRNQALCLCVVGVPIGVFVGYVIGDFMMPMVMASTTFGAECATTSTSPVIWMGSILFAVLTVFLSCGKPGKEAAKVSPVMAVRYTEGEVASKKEKRYRGAKVHQMAFANLFRNKRKTSLVLISLSLAVVLLNVLVSFVRGMDMDTYLSQFNCADFVVGKTDYFHSKIDGDSLDVYEIDWIQENTQAAQGGCGYADRYSTAVWMEEDVCRKLYPEYYSEEEEQEMLSLMEKRDGKVCMDSQVEGLDAPLLDKLKVVEGDLSQIYDEKVANIAIEVAMDDYGNVSHRERYPAIGDTIVVSYVDKWEFWDRSTDQPCTENSAPEDIVSRIVSSRDVTYRVCAWVEVPYSISYRFSHLSYGLVLPTDSLRRDCGEDIQPLFYAFDTPDEASRMDAEAFLQQVTADHQSPLMYESKETTRAEFEQFRQMFLIMGGTLCGIIGLVGILNFFNAIMTGIIARKREFAVLQAVGMTGRQLKQMLVYEGLFYAAGLSGIALVVSLILQSFLGNTIAQIFWFYKPCFTILPVVIMIPVFGLLGWLIPLGMYSQLHKQSVVERLITEE